MSAASTCLAGAARRCGCVPGGPVRKTLNQPSLRYAAISQTQLLHSIRKVGKTSPENWDPAGELSQRVRLLLRRFPHPVVILTTRQPPATPSDSVDVSEFRAVTLSSLTSVCIKPRPIICFNLKLPSNTYNAIKANDGKFLIHFLRPTARMASLALESTKGQENVQKMLRLSAGNDTKFTSDPSAGDSLLLLGKGILKIMRCQLLGIDKEMFVEDHAVVCAQVRDVFDSPMNLTSRTQDFDFNLLYVDGEFRSIGPEIPVESRPQQLNHR